jgi:ABC-type glutathione transport system ATPase component
MSTTRLGKKVIELEDVGVTLGDRVIVKPFTWRLAPGERTGILGANGAGKTTVLKLLEGSQQPTVGKIGRGSTVNLSLLDQRLATLDHVKNDRVSEVIARHKTTYKADGVEMTPGQLLERLGFSSAHLSARVFELSGGQRRRLQFLLELLREPNVLLLDEPTNDLDTDMLRAMEDLLDTWPGTLIVVSHDRYLLERITDQQYAIVDGEFRHVPGGVDQYLELEKTRTLIQHKPAPEAGHPPSPQESPGPPSLRPGSKEHREAEKEHAMLGRKIAKLTTELAAVDHDLAASDQADYEGLAAIARKRAGLEAERQGCEEKWLDLEVALEP